MVELLALGDVDKEGFFLTFFASLSGLGMDIFFQKNFIEKK